MSKISIKNVSALTLFIFFLQEASPLLVKASPTPLSLDQLNQPPAMAYACVMAAANGQPTPVADYGPRLAPAPPHSPDVGQLAFMEVGLDRTGKKVSAIFLF